MLKHIMHIALVVPDYDEAIDYYTNILGFKLIENTILEESKRWVLVSPSATSETALLLAKADNEQQKSYIGNQAGGRVMLFLATDDFWTDYNAFVEKGVKIVRPPSEESFGIVAVFQDLYGNLWDLIQRK